MPELCSLRRSASQVLNQLQPVFVCRGLHHLSLCLISYAFLLHTSRHNVRLRYSHLGQQMQMGLWVLGSCAMTISCTCLLGKVTCAEMSQSTQRLVKYICMKTALVSMAVMPELAMWQWLPW